MSSVIGPSTAFYTTSAFVSENAIKITCFAYNIVSIPMVIAFLGTLFKPKKSLAASV